MRLIMQNPIEFAVPAILGAPLEQVFLGAINRQQRGKQATKATIEGKKKPDSKGEPTIQQDVLGAEGSSFIGALLGAFGIGGR